MTIDDLNSENRLFLFGWDGADFIETPLVRIGKHGKNLWIWDGSDNHLIYLTDYEWKSDDGAGSVSIERDGEMILYISPVNEWPGVDVLAMTESVKNARKNIQTPEGAEFLENLISIHSRDKV